MKKILFAALCAWMMGLTVLCVRTWGTLNGEQKAFEQMAERVKEARQQSQEPTRAEPGREEGGQAVTGEMKTGEVQGIGEILPEYEPLVTENPDFAGWLLIEGTNINYPVMQTEEDREFYLYRDFYKQDSFAGTPFVGSGDLGDKDGDLFVYGHHMKNQTMFSELLNYRKEAFWKTHQTVSLDGRCERRRYTVFCALYVDEAQWTDREGLFFGSRKRDRKEWVKRLIGSGLYETGAVPGEDAPLLFLVTCSYQAEGSRFVVAAFKN